MPNNQATIMLSLVSSHGSVDAPGVALRSTRRRMKNHRNAYEYRVLVQHCRGAAGGC